MPEPETTHDAIVTITIDQTRRGTQVSTQVQASTALGEAVPEILSQIAVTAGQQLANVVGAACAANATALRVHNLRIRPDPPEMPVTPIPGIGRA